jgi:class 3 adenylate cyclase
MKLTPGDSVPASVALVGIRDAATFSSIQLYRSLMSLHAVIREHFGATESVGVLSSLKGLFLIFPDQREGGRPGGQLPHEHVCKIARLCGERGLAIQAGLTYGYLRVVADYDNGPGMVGGPLNRAARLFKAPIESPGVEKTPATPTHHTLLLDAQYVEARCQFHAQLQDWRNVDAFGKRDEVFPGCWLAPADTWGGIESSNSASWPCKDAPQAPVTSTLLAFDLRAWSSGELAVLQQRFSGLRDSLHRCMAQLGLQMLFCAPGGDGAVVGLTSRASGPGFAGAAIGVSLAQNLLSDLAIASQERGAPIALDTRIGVHYGEVALYTTADDVPRPCGLEVLVVDELADENSLKGPGLVISGTVAEALYDGSSAKLGSEWTKLEALTVGTRKVARWGKREELPGRTNRTSDFH